MGETVLSKLQVGLESVHGTAVPATDWANIGNTEKTGTLRAFDIQLMTGLHPKMQGGANKYFDTHGEGPFKVIATLVLEGNAAAVENGNYKKVSNWPEPEIQPEDQPPAEDPPGDDNKEKES